MAYNERTPEEGVAQGKLEIINLMLSGGEPIDKIAKFTGLSESEIKNIPSE